MRSAEAEGRGVRCGAPRPKAEAFTGARRGRRPRRSLRSAKAEGRGVCRRAPRPKAEALAMLNVSLGTHALGYTYEAVDLIAL